MLTFASTNAFLLPGKQIITTLLLLALLGQTFNRGVILTSYYTNTESYAKNCENKAKPVLKCHGKCQLMKKLKQEENKDRSNPDRRGYQDEVLSSKSFYATIGSVYCAPLAHATVYTATIPELRPISFFHPPGLG